jgi:hypothetical protein
MNLSNPAHHECAPVGRIRTDSDKVSVPLGLSLLAVQSASMIKWVSLLAEIVAVECGDLNID